VCQLAFHYCKKIPVGNQLKVGKAYFWLMFSSQGHLASLFWARGKAEYRIPWWWEHVVREYAYLMDARRCWGKVQGRDSPFKGMFPVMYFLQLGIIS
jgi:hypothetical protein